METIMIDGNEHEIGNEKCESCLREPIYCKCGGLIHNVFGDESYLYDYWLFYKCDKCGSTGRLYEREIKE